MVIHALRWQTCSYAVKLKNHALPLKVSLSAWPQPVVTIIATDISFWRWRVEGPISPLQSQPTKTSYRNDRFSHIQIVVFPWHASPNGHVIQEWNLFWFRSYLNFVPPVPWRWLNNFILFHFWKLPSHGSHFDSSLGQTQTGTSQGLVNSAFFKFRLFIASVKTQWEPFRMTIHQDN